MDEKKKWLAKTKKNMFLGKISFSSLNFYKRFFFSKLCKMFYFSSFYLYLLVYVLSGLMEC